MLVHDSKVQFTQTSSLYGGTLRWLAPELLWHDVKEPKSCASDIYAFGCVCYEVVLAILLLVPLICTQET